MPNWCECTLSVAGSVEEVARFKLCVSVRSPQDVGSSPPCLSFHSLVPQPELPGDGWYHWRLGHWGTKWEVNGAILVIDEPEFLQYSFDTAWSPPQEWLQAIGPQFPELSFRLFYAEGGGYFAGAVSVRGDEVTSEEKHYIDAMIERDGSYEIQCDHCPELTTITVRAETYMCQTCRQERCAHCKEIKKHHMGKKKKCPFSTTSFKHFPEDPNALGEA